MSLPENLNGEALLKWQADMEDQLEKTLAGWTEVALVTILKQALAGDLMAAAARHFWEEAVDQTLVELGLTEDRFLRTDLLDAQIGDEAYEAVQQVTAMRLAPEDLEAALLEALDLNASLLAAGFTLPEKTVLKWKTKIKRQVRTAFTGVANRLIVGILRVRGSKFKTWVTKHDNRVRDTHREADGQTVPIDQPFQVGSESLMYPGEAGKALEEIANCRCVLVPG